MDQTKRALIFANGTGGDPLLNAVLKETNIFALSPSEIANHSNDVAIIIIDRPSANAVKICGNLRNQDHFSRIPILILVDPPTTTDLAQLSSFGADILTKPVSARALRHYLTNMVLHAGNNGKGKASDQKPIVEKAQEQSVAPKEEDQPPAVQGTSAKVSAAVKKAVVEEKFVLADEIPRSNRLLSEATASMSLAKGGKLCSNCRRWECRDEDIFCSGCGGSLAILEDLDDSITFEPRGDHRVARLVELKNAGQNPLRLAFKVVAYDQLKDRFDLHVQNTTLEGGRAGHLQVTFDASGLDLSTRHHAALQIHSNEKGNHVRHIDLIVDRLAIPRVVAEQSYAFVLGADNEWDFNLANDGGGTLIPTRVRIDESPLEFSASASIRSGQNLPLRLKVPKLELQVGNHPKKLIWEFEHYSPVAIDIIVSVVRPPRMTVQPSEFDLGVVSTRRSLHLSLSIFNSGGEDLILSSITSPVEWMRCLDQMPLTVPPGHSKVVNILVEGSPRLAGSRSSEITIQSNSYRNSIQAAPCRVKFVEPGAYQDYIGIDFGTSASCVAVLYEDKPVVIELDKVEQGSSSDPRLMPSILYFNEEGTVLAGREASFAAAIQPANAVTSIKRVLGIKHSKVFAGREFSATQLASKVLEQLLIRTEDSLFRFGQYQTPRRAVITVPVEFHDNQRRALLEACALAGLELNSHAYNGIVIDEAHAAALYYLHKKLLQFEADDAEMNGIERVLIFDCGGGTLDCAIIEIENSDEKVIFKTLSSGGDQNLGGEDIDWTLVALLADMVGQTHADFDAACLGDERKLAHRFQNPELLKAAMATRSTFKNQAESAKIALSAAPEVQVFLTPLLSRNATPLQPYIMPSQPAGDLRPVRMDVTLRQADLQRVLDPFLTRAAGVIKTVCHRAGLGLESVNTILHTGRTSFLPMIRERINGLLPNAEDGSSLVEPKTCVALGAAFWGAIKDKPGTNIEFVGSANRLPQDVGYISVKFVKRVFAPIFPAQTEFPCEKVVEFTNGGESLELLLAENRGKSTLVDGNMEVSVIGRMRIVISNPGARLIAVHFAINENRVLEVTVDGKKQQMLEMADD